PKPAYKVQARDQFVAAGSSTTLTAKRSDGETVPVSWSVRGGVAGDRVSSSGVFTPALPDARNVTIVAKDADGATGSTTVRVGLPFDAPGSLRLSSDVGETLELRASWAKPPRTGGAAVADYIVRTIPSTGNHVL